jgi:glutamate carboxypeptidase
MKGGITACLIALDRLKEAGALDKLPVTVVLNSDEERGAPTGRELFAELIPNTRAALFSECGGPNGELVIARRGKISYRVECRGEAAHAGNMAGGKRSGLLDLAHKIISIENLNARFEGTSVNAGRAWGGMAGNTVAAEATALVDIRYPKAETEQPLRDAMQRICARPGVEGVACALTETSYRPVWDRSEISLPLAELARRVGGQEGVGIKAVPRGGTADSNWFGAAGVPTLDGLGPVGFDDHTPRERIRIETLFERGRLLAELLPAIEEAFPA